MVDLPGLRFRVSLPAAFSSNLPRRIINSSLQWLCAVMLLGLALQASAAINYVQGNTNGISNGTRVSTSYLGAQTAGDTNIVVVSWYDPNPRTVSVTDTDGNVYALAISTALQGTTQVYYAKNIASAGANANVVTVALDSNAPYVELSITEYSGIDTVNPLDAVAGATGNGTVANSGSITTSNANDLLFGNAYVGQWASTAGAGYTKRFNTYWGDAVEDEIVTGTGSYNATLTQNASDWWVMQMVAFKASNDTEAPTAPTSLTATATSGSQINLSWTASADNVGVTGYEVERCQGTSCSDFAQIASSTLTSYSDTTLSASTSYSYRVRAMDAAGNVSGYSSTASATTSNDAAPAIHYIQGNTNGASSGSGLSATYINAQTAGDTNIIVLSWYDTSPRVVSITDTMGNIYARAITTAGPQDSNEGTTSVYYAKNITAAAANANTVTVTLDSSEPYVELSITEYSGIDPLNPLDTAVGTTGTGVVANSGSATIDNANDLLFGNAYVAQWADAAGPGYTKRFETYWGDGVEDEIVTGTGSYNASMSQQANDWWIMQMVAFRAAGSQTVDTTSPSMPTGLVATAASSTQINLSWTASDDDVGVTGYLLERCVGTSCSTFAQIASPTTTSYSDTALSASTSYSYRVRATDAAGNLSSYSSVTSATTQALPDTTPPTAPTGLIATATSSSQINLSWTASTDNVSVTGYVIERCQDANCSTFSQLAIAATTSYSDTALLSSTAYSYRILATDAAGNLSDYSTIASATTQALPDTTPPSAPTNVSATGVSSSQINLSWTTATDNVAVTNYLIERCEGAGCNNFTQVATTAGTTFSDTSLTPATHYVYRVRAADAANNLSGYSDVAVAATQYGGPMTYTYSYDNLGRVIQATGSDGSVITYTYDANGNVTTLNRQ